MAAEVPPGFSFPSGAAAPLAARVIQAIYGDPRAIELLPYAISLDTQIRIRESADRAGAAPLPDRRVPSGRWLPTFSYPRWSGDVLVVGECRRDAEVALMARIVDGIVRSGRSVLYLSTSRSEHATILRHRRDAGWGLRCTLSRIATVGRDRLQYWLHRGAPAQMQRDAHALAALLAAHDARMSPGATWTMREVATAKVQWQILKRRLSFRCGVITRTNYAPLSAALLADCFAGGQLSISLQHSIVTCPSSFSPLLPRRYLCFGDGSRAVLRKLDEELAGAVQGAGSGCELVVAGSFLDPMPPAATPSASATVMIVDQTSDWALPFYGCGRAAFDSLFQLVTVLAGSPAVRRVLVRLHPTGDGERMWKEIAARFPDRVVLGPWQRPLQADLSEASVVVGLFSTVLATAAAAGLPTLFLWQPGWFYTPDLAPFAATQLVAPSEALARIESLLLDPNHFAAECDTARAAGATYFNGRNCDFGPELLEELLRPRVQLFKV